MRSRGFSLIELLVVVVVIVLLIAILVPTVAKALESSRRAKCAANLSMIGKAFRGYSEDCGEFPRTVWRSFNMPAYWPSYFGDHHVVVVAFSGARGYDPFGGNKPAGDTTNLASDENSRPYDNDATAALFLLIKQERVNAASFVCPSAKDYYPDTFEPARKRSHGGKPDDQQPDGNPAWRSNFTRKNNLSYSVTIPYPSRAYDETASGTPSAMDVGYRFDSKMKPSMALMADMNPGDPALLNLSLSSGGADMRRGNSRNHGQGGQNVLYVTGDVQWAKTPFAGSLQDNIYTRAGGTISDQFGGNPPLSANDSVLVPAETGLNTGTMMPY